MNRREMLGGMLALGGVFASSAIVANAQSENPKTMQRFEQQGGDFSWIPQKLDPNEVAQLAHAAYHHKGYG